MGNFPNRTVAFLAVERKYIPEQWPQLNVPLFESKLKKYDFRKIWPMQKTMKYPTPL